MIRPNFVSQGYKIVRIHKNKMLTQNPDLLKFMFPGKSKNYPDRLSTPAAT